MLRCFVVLVSFVLSAMSVAGQEPDLSGLPYWIQAQMVPKTVPPTVSNSARIKSDSEFWAERIDETWGVGLSTGEKLFFFDTFWHAIDDEFACFQGLDVDWSALRDLYRPEVASGVSKGRFAAILSRLSLALMEAHTVALDRVVFWRTAAAPGVPLLKVGGWGYVREFGACLTPLPDRSLLVYKALPDHPLGLVPGDIITGYESRAWTELYPEMLRYGLPVSGFWGSNEETYEHAWLMAAGANWHLFDTIDVVRHDSGESEHLATMSMVGLQRAIVVHRANPGRGCGETGFCP